MKVYDNLRYIVDPKLDDGSYYIYVIENDAGNIKVGITANIIQRVSSLSGSNTGGNIPIRVAVSSPTYLKTIEKIIHDHYHNKRVIRTEWFKDITFNEVIEFTESLFNSASYIRCNETRKARYIDKQTKCNKENN